MENATKALLIAGGVLIAILIITVMVMLFNSTGNVSRSYNDRIETEEVTKFNANFTQYLRQDLTIHDVISICNFAKQNGVEVLGAQNYSIEKDLEKIETVQDSNGNIKRKQPAYQIQIDDENGYDYETGKIKQISFTYLGVKIINEKAN